KNYSVRETGITGLPLKQGSSSDGRGRNESQVSPGKHRPSGTSILSSGAEELCALIDVSRWVRSRESSPPCVGSPNPPLIPSLIPSSSHYLFRPGCKPHPRVHSAHQGRAPTPTSLDPGRVPLFRRV